MEKSSTSGAGESLGLGSRLILHTKTSISSGEMAQQGTPIVALTEAWSLVPESTSGGS